MASDQESGTGSVCNRVRRRTRVGLLERVQMELDTLNGPCEGTLSIGGVETHILFDTRATHSFVSS